MIPIIVTTLPVTTGGKNLTKYEKNGAMMTTNIPDKKREPYKSPIPLVCPIKIIGATAVNVQPKTMGNPVPVPFQTCKNVATPHIKISIVIKKAICSGVKSKLVPTIISTCISPAYIANRCCKLKMNVFIIVPLQMSLCYHLEKQLYIKTILSILLFLNVLCL